MSLEHVIVDGSNIATEGRKLPSMQQLDEAVTAFLTEFPDVKLTVVVDATFPNRIDQSERDQFEKAVLDGTLVTPPAGVIGRGDAFILQIADKVDAVVLSNDSFQEFHGDYDWLLDEGRVIGGKPVPAVGWVFIFRTPVQGPKSRQAQSAKRGQKVSNLPPLPVPKTPPPSPRKRTAKKDDDSTSSESAKKDEGSPSGGRSRKKADPKGDGEAKSSSKADASATKVSSSKKPQESFNEIMAFLEFAGAHPVGSEITATVDRFSSHGAYVRTEAGVQCYIPLKSMADPAPNSAREVLTIGEDRTFVVLEFDNLLHGIDVGIPGVVSPDPVEVAPVDDPESSADADEPVEATADSDEAPAEKAPAEKTGAKKTGAKKTGAKKAPAKRTTAGKTTSKKTAATKKTAAKKATADKAAAGKTTAKRTAAKKSAAAKPAIADETPATDSSVEEVPTKKAAAKKTTAAKKSSAAKKTVATGTTAKKTAAKKSAAKKATAKKSSAEKTVAKKATAKKTAAKKATAVKKTAAKKTGAVKKTAVKKRTAAEKAPAKKTAAEKTRGG